MYVKTTLKLDKPTIHSSLRASTWDGVFASIFNSITSGVLLNNFLLQLGASPIEIGILSSVPLLVNLLQPIGAYVSDRTTSRRWYGWCLFGLARILWLILVVGIALVKWHQIPPHALISLTLAMALATNFIGAFGSASWLSWMTVLVPRRLRGRYFGMRNGASSLTTLIGVPLVGIAVSSWSGGAIQGYGVILLLGVLAGLVSLGCQFWMADVNPQQQVDSGLGLDREADQNDLTSFRLKRNFLIYLLYFSLWTFAVNVCEPFFSLYLLDDLNIDISIVTIYSSLTAGATWLMLFVWGKQADRMGNRPIMILVGVILALIPLFWMGIRANFASVWFWLPLLYLLMGVFWAAMNLCNTNLQMAIAPGTYQATYFGVAAAVSGVAGAVGITLGGFLAEKFSLLEAFALSGGLRLMAMLLLLLVQEPQSKSLAQVMRDLLPTPREQVPVTATLQAQALTSSTSSKL